MRRPFWRPVVLPRPAGLACLLSAVLLIVLARLLADRAVMSLGLALAGLFVLSLVLLLLGWLAPPGNDGLPQGPGWRWLVRPRGVRTAERWQRLDQDGRVVADFVGPTPDRRGMWHRVGRRVRWIDPFGLWQACRIVRNSTERVITPDPDDAFSAAVASPLAGVIPDDHETGMIREYARGDALHLINWKQSARHDELMVRQKERRAHPRLLVALDGAPADEGAYDRTAELLYGLLCLSRRRGWSAVLIDGRHTYENPADQDRLCAGLYPPEATTTAADRVISAVRAASRPTTPILLVSPVAGSPSAETIAGALRTAGRTVSLAVPTRRRAPGHDEAARKERTHHQVETDARGGGSRHDDLPAIWHRRGVRVLRRTVVPSACLAVLIAVALYGLSRLFSTGVYLWAFATLLGLAVLAAWLPRPHRRDRSALLCVGEVVLLALVALGFIAALASRAYRTGWVPFFSPELPQASTAAAAGRVGSGQGARPPAAQTGGTIFVGAPGSPSLTRLIQTGIDDFYSLVLPLDVTAGEQAVLIAGFGLLAMIARLMLIWRQNAPLLSVLALVPLVADWQVQGVGAPLWAVLAVLGAVVMLLWAPHAHRLAFPLPAVVAVAVIAASSVASPSLVQGSADQLDLFGNGGSLFSSSSINPLVDLKRGLTRNSSTVAFTYASTGRLRFRLATLTDLNGATWSFDQSLGQQAHLYSPQSQTGGTGSDGTASTGQSPWQRMMTYDYPSSARGAYPRQSPFERAVQGLAVLDRADQEAGTSSASGWRQTADADARTREKSERENLTRTLATSSRVSIADLSTRFLPLAGSPQGVRGIAGQWDWNRDRVVYNSNDSTTSSMRYTQRSQYLPAISSASQLSSGQTLGRMVDLRRTYQKRCATALTAIPDPGGIRARDWTSWYRRLGRLNLTRDQLQAWSSCLVDFSHGDSSDQSDQWQSQSNQQYMFSSSLRGSVWALDDDPDSSYLPAGSTGVVTGSSGAGGSDGAMSNPYSVYNASGQGQEAAAVKALIGRQYRMLPARLPAEITRVVRRARRAGVNISGADAADQIGAMTWLVRFFSDKSFVYSLSAPDGGGTDNLRMIARFLKERRGYCVHYASALAVLARAMGVPTRLVLGYSPDSAVLDGEDTGSGTTTYATSQNQLHSWVEAYINGVGWVPFDVTPGFSDSASSTRRASVSAEEVRRARERGSRRATHSGTTDSRGAGAERRQNATSPQRTAPDRKSDGGVASRSGSAQTQKRRSASSDSSAAAASSRGHARRRQTMVVVGALTAAGLCAVLLVVLGPVCADRLRRRRLARLIRAAGVAGEGGDDDSAARAQKAWGAVWGQVLRSARKAGVRSGSTEGVEDCAARLIALVPARERFVRTLARAEQTLLYGGPGSRGALRLTSQSAHRLEEQTEGLLDDLRAITRSRRMKVQHR